MAPSGPASTIHASAVCYDDIGILLRGPSGSGKSDLALRLISDGARLVADDRVLLAYGETGPELRVPEAMAGLIEVRGMGIVSVPYVARAPLRLVADIVPGGTVARLPEPSRFEYEGFAVPRMAVAAFEESAVAKLRLYAYASAGRPDPVTGAIPAGDGNPPGGSPP